MPNQLEVVANPEKIAYWFFRLNGCLTIVNFIIHPDLIQRDEPSGQRTDADILAIRFPHRCELLTARQPMEDHPVFKVNSKIDLIIAEVKHGACRLNGPWIRSADANMHRLLYAIGVFPKDQVAEVAQALYRRGLYRDETILVRLFAIGLRRNKNLKNSIVQLTWEEILGFIHKRFKQYSRHKAHNQQWDEVGRLLYSSTQAKSEGVYIATWMGAMDKFIQNPFIHGVLNDCA